MDFTTMANGDIKKNKYLNLYILFRILYRLQKRPIIIIRNLVLHYYMINI